MRVVQETFEEHHPLPTRAGEQVASEDILKNSDKKPPYSLIVSGVSTIVVYLILLKVRHQRFGSGMSLLVGTFRVAEEAAVNAIQVNVIHRDLDRSDRFS